MPPSVDTANATDEVEAADSPRRIDGVDAFAVDQLPVTATEIASWAIALIAVAIVVIGGVVLLVSRRRKAARAEDDAADAPAPSDGATGA